MTQLGTLGMSIPVDRSTVRENYVHRQTLFRLGFVQEIVIYARWPRAASPYLLSAKASPPQGKLMIVRAVERAAGWRIRSSLISFGEFVA